MIHPHGVTNKAQRLTQTCIVLIPHDLQKALSQCTSLIRIINSYRVFHKCFLFNCNYYKCCPVLKTKKERLTFYFVLFVGLYLFIDNIYNSKRNLCAIFQYRTTFIIISLILIKNAFVKNYRDTS